MSTSTSEVGHAINVANFNTLITYCTGYGTVYNPALQAIQLSQLQTKHDQAKQKLNEVEIKKAFLNKAINERIAAFDGLETLCTIVTNAFAVSGAPAADVKDLQAINRKIQGPGKKKPSTGETAIEGISTSQQSYDSKINFFINFIQFLETKPIYNPNETTLKTPALHTKLTLMETKNTAFDQAFFNYNQERNGRNEELYNPVTGLVQASKDVKKYARSIFGYSSPEFQQLNDLNFKVVKKY
jgi:hypothetical protein